MSRALPTAHAVDAMRRVLQAWANWEGPVLTEVWPESGGFSVVGHYYDDYVALQLAREDALDLAAIAMEAASAGETVGLDLKGDSADPKGIAR